MYSQELIWSEIFIASLVGRQLAMKLNLKLLYNPTENFSHRYIMKWKDLNLGICKAANYILCGKSGWQFKLPQVDMKYLSSFQPSYWHFQEENKIFYSCLQVLQKMGTYAIFSHYKYPTFKLFLNWKQRNILTPLPSPYEKTTEYIKYPDHNPEHTQENTECRNVEYT